jgi:hypothetical protein
MRNNSEAEQFIDLLAGGHAGSIHSVNQAGVPEAFMRYKLTQDECQKRGVRFLPAQVMRPILQAAGI